MLEYSFAVIRILSYFLASIFFARGLNYSLFEYRLRELAKEPCDNCVDDIILNVGFVLMFTAMVISNITLEWFPEYYISTDSLINPGSLLVLLMLLKRIPRWLRGLKAARGK